MEVIGYLMQNEFDVFCNKNIQSQLTLQESRLYRELQPNQLFLFKGEKDKNHYRGIRLGLPYPYKSYAELMMDYKVENETSHVIIVTRMR